MSYSVNTTAKIQRLGNSKCVIIPKQVIEDMEIEKDKEISFKYDNGVITLKKNEK